MTSVARDVDFIYYKNKDMKIGFTISVSPEDEEFIESEAKRLADEDFDSKIEQIITKEESGESLNKFEEYLLSAFAAMIAKVEYTLSNPKHNNRSKTCRRMRRSRRL
jgi:hypothetical protein